MPTTLWALGMWGWAGGGRDPRGGAEEAGHHCGSSTVGGVSVVFSWWGEADAELVQVQMLNDLKPPIM